MDDQGREMIINRDVEQYSDTFGFNNEGDFKSFLQNKKVLDAGCGKGMLKNELGDSFNITNLDVNHIPGSISVQALAERMPFPNDTFDIILCNNSLFIYGQEGKDMSLEQSVTLQAQEAHRVLKTGGKLCAILLPVNVASVPNQDSNFFLYTSFTSNECTYGPTLKLLLDTGFVIEKIENFKTKDTEVVSTRVVLVKK